MLISAGVTLDFVEDEAGGTIHAYLVESAVLAEYRAEWRLVEEEDGGRTRTRMLYSGVASPRGPVPQRLVEWQMRRDVPMNLRALAAYAEALYGQGQAEEGVTPPGTEDGEGEEENDDEGFVLAKEWVDDEEEEMKDAEAGDHGERRQRQQQHRGKEVDVEVVPATGCCIPVVRRLMVSRQ